MEAVLISAADPIEENQVGGHKGGPSKGYEPQGDIHLQLRSWN